jgi:hypothetical protein
LLKELKHLFYALRIELVTDGFQVLRFVLPEIDLNQGIGVVVIFEGIFWVLLELSFDLLGPVHEGSFWNCCLVLG